MDQGRIRVFMGYTSTTSQLKVYAPDLGYTIRSSIVKINEDIPGDFVNLKIRNSPNGQGTPTDLVVRGSNIKNSDQTSIPKSPAEPVINPNTTRPVVEILIKEAPVVTHTIADQDQDEDDSRSVLSDTI
jgi:hypothetical protein